MFFQVYSGYFKHNIESGLTGAELMLTLMGYRPIGDDGTYILEGPVDPDRVVSVSRDSLVALVECQVGFLIILYTTHEDSSIIYKFHEIACHNYAEHCKY